LYVYLSPSEQFYLLATHRSIPAFQSSKRSLKLFCESSLRNSPIFPIKTHVTNGRLCRPFSSKSHDTFCLFIAHFSQVGSQKLKKKISKLRKPNGAWF